MPATTDTRPARANAPDFYSLAADALERNWPHALRPAMGRSDFRIQAVWRGGGDRNVSVNLTTGVCTDWVTHERFSFLHLMKLLSHPIDIEDLPEVTQEKLKQAKFQRSAAQMKADRTWARAKVLDPQCGDPAHQAACRYLERRGFSAATIAHVAPQLRVEPHNHATYFLYIPMLSQTPAAHLHDPVSLQRLWLDADGNRLLQTSKKAKKYFMGSTRDSNHAPRAFIIPGDERGTGVFAISEGFESGLSAYQAKGWPVIVAFDSGGVKDFDVPALTQMLTRQSMQLARRDPDQAVKFVILADNDPPKIDPRGRQVGRGGQRAAHRLAQRLTRIVTGVFIAMPPEPGQDWNDLLNLRGDAATAALLDAAEEHVHQANAKPEEAPTFHETGEATPRAPGLSRDVAKERLDRAMEAAVLDTAPRLIAAETGLGKTFSMADIMRGWGAQRGTNDRRLVVATRNKDLAAELAFLAESDIYFGRSGDPGSPGFCHRIIPVQALGEKHHSIAAHECQSCIHGLASARQSSPKEEFRVDADDKLRAELRKQHPGLSKPELDQVVSGTPDCPWMNARYAAREAGTLTMTHQAAVTDYSGTLTKNAKIVYDESVPLTTRRVITPADVDAWWANVDKIDPGDDAARNAWRTDALATLDALAQLMARPFRKKCVPFTADNGTVRELAGGPDQAARLMDGLKRMVAGAAKDKRDGTVIEAVQYEQFVRTLIPLKVLADLVKAIDSGTIWLERNRDPDTAQAGTTLVLHVPTLVTDQLKKGAVILDATPPMVMHELIRQAGGHVHEIRVAQPNLAVHFHYGVAHGRGYLKGDRLLWEADRLQQVMIETAATAPMNRCAVITHKPLAIEMQRRIKAMAIPGWTDPRRVGWWGRDEVGHNDWDDSADVIAWGLPFKPPHVFAQEFAAENQLIGGLWGDWTDDWEMQDVPLPSATGAHLRAKMPTNPHQAAWLVDRLTRDVVQTIGRPRAVRRPDEPVRVHIHADFPLAGHGLFFSECHASPFRSRAQHREATSREAQERYALARLAGAKTYDEVNAVLRLFGRQTLSKTTISKYKRSGVDCELVGQLIKQITDFAGDDSAVIGDCLADLLAAPPDSVHGAAGEILLRFMQPRPDAAPPPETSPPALVAAPPG